MGINRRFFLKSCVLSAGVASWGPLLEHATANDYDEIGKVYPGWHPGEMDIHHIYTGKGESVFHIFPDATSLLIDAGDRTDIDRLPMDKRSEFLPNDSKPAGEWIARYIRRVNPHDKEVDWFLVSHYDSDHLGRADEIIPMTHGRGEDYRLSGLTLVGELIHFKRGMDRSYPDYNTPDTAGNVQVDNYRKFVKWKSKEGLRMEKFQPGRLNQLSLVHHPEQYSGQFQIRNLAANGVVWTGKGELSAPFLEPEQTGKKLTENMRSLASLISWGPFRYYTGGDLVNGTVRNRSGVGLEEAVGRLCGPVHVCKTNHHAFRDSMSEEFVKAVRARVYLIDFVTVSHIEPITMERMTSPLLNAGKTLVCSTNIPALSREKYRQEKWMTSLAPEDGHIVVKVFNEGRQFKIYRLTARDESMKILNVYGPFSAE